MTETNEANNQPTIEQQLAESQSIISKLQAEVQAIKSNRDDLLNEAKAAKAKAREAAEHAEQQKLEKAKKDGDYKQLLESSEKERSTLAKQLEEYVTRISSEKTKTESMRIAAELADGHNAELLAEFISRRIRYTEDGIKVLDTSGQLTVSTLEDLKSEFANGDKYRSLLRGNKASGGGASGSTSSTSANKTIERSAFDKLSAKDKMAAAKSGVQVIDNQH